MFELVFVAVILLVTIVIPLWIVMHYMSKS